MTGKTCDTCACAREDKKRPHLRGHGICTYPLTGELAGGGMVWPGKAACGYYVEAPPEMPEQMELAL